jgi:hypothetical protein
MLILANLKTFLEWFYLETKEMKFKGQGIIFLWFVKILIGITFCKGSLGIFVSGNVQK